MLKKASSRENSPCCSYVSKPSTPQMLSSGTSRTSSRAYPGGTPAMHARTMPTEGRVLPPLPLPLLVLPLPLLLYFQTSTCGQVGIHG